MLHIERFTFNPFQENTYLIINEKKDCWIVDPGMYDVAEYQQLTNYISQHQLKPQAIINTHAHIDHIFGVQRLKKEYSISFSIHEKDLPVLQNAVGTAMMFGLDFNQTPSVDSFLKETTSYSLGDDEVEIRFTPGHSPGSVVFYYVPGNWVIAGDVLFQGSIGRTDLPGGNFDTLIQSIRQQLFTLPENTTVYPGHGPATTIAQEKEYNPFLQGM
ncbi:MAG TPA: MBL fold metallo-hydrolase [Flavipsychrobacter sp.]|nr:MBL fold metallo-hydrolase [Flavipsychrobacter sp.]